MSVLTIINVIYLGGQQRPVLPRADLSVHQVSIRNGVSRLAEQHQVGLQITTVRRETFSLTFLEEDSFIILSEC